MKNHITSLALVASFALVGCAQDSARSVAAHACSQWGREILRVRARGVQSYRVEAGGDGKLVLKFTGPRADLFDESGRKVGTHFLGDTGPVWEIDAERVVGKKVRERPSPNVDSIPELQLAATVSGNARVLVGTTLIERVDTVGGVAPRLVASLHAGDTVESPYSAEYVFYAATL